MKPDRQSPEWRKYFFAALEFFDARRDLELDALACALWCVTDNLAAVIESLNSDCVEWLLNEVENGSVPGGEDVID